MYSHEIENLLRFKNYLLNNEEYLYIIKSSPQINQIKYDNFVKVFEMWTSDNYYFKYKVYHKNDLTKKRMF